MFSLNLFVFILKCLCMKQVFCLPLVNETQSLYDQRQTGKYNIHISLRDVAIIEVDKNEFSDDTISNADEYYYDDEDLTIKPISNWFSTTIQTPQLITTSLKSEVKNSQPIQNNKKVEKHTSQSSQPNQLTNMTLLESSLGPNPNSSFPSSERISLESGEGASLVREPVSHIHTEARHLYIPNSSVSNKQKNQQEISKEHILSEALRREQKLNAAILSFISARTAFSKGTALCRNNQLRDAYGNCRSFKHPTFLKSIFDVLKLMRVKE